MKILEQFVKDNKNKIDDWFANRVHVAPLFCSIDIRNSGFKVAHVDANLFPAGFNNLNCNSIKLSAKSIYNFIAKEHNNIKKLLLVPEYFTRNIKYLENVAALKVILEKANFEVKIGLPADFIDKEGQAHGVFEIHIISNPGNQITVDEDWQPDLIILNNDLTSGLPKVLENSNQPILPDPKFGWHNRLKSIHFEAYRRVTDKFAKDFLLDPWLLSLYFENCEDVSFRQKTGLNCLAQSVEKMLFKIQKKYDEYGIKEKPYVFIKANKGTYGMGVMSVHSPEEVLNINKKHRHSMDVIKSGVHNNSVIIQEGVPTVETYQGHAAETLVYLVNGDVVGTFMRHNAMHDSLSNLNAKGMELASVEQEDFEIKMLISKLASISVGYEKL